MKKVLSAYIALAALALAVWAALPAFAQLPTPAVLGASEPVLRVRGSAVPGEFP